MIFKKRCRKCGRFYDMMTCEHCNERRYGKLINSFAEGLERQKERRKKK